MRADEWDRSLARFAGALLLVHTAVALLHYVLIEQHLLLQRGVRRISAAIVSRPAWFDLGIAHDLILFQLGMVLSIALRGLLRRSHPELSLQALWLKLLAGVLAIVIELSSFAARQLAQGGQHLAALDESQRQALLGLVLGLRAEGYVLVMLLYAPGTGLFAYLLARSGRLPWVVGGAGTLASVLLWTTALARIATASLPGPASAFESVARGAAVLSMLFQIATGLWLIATAVPKDRKRAEPRVVT